MPTVVPGGESAATENDWSAMTGAWLRPGDADREDQARRTALAVVGGHGHVVVAGLGRSAGDLAGGRVPGQPDGQAADGDGDLVTVLVGGSDRDRVDRLVLRRLHVVDRVDDGSVVGVGDRDGHLRRRWSRVPSEARTVRV